MVVLGNPPSPSQKGYLLVIYIRIPPPCWVPQGIGGGLLGVHSAHGVRPPYEDPPEAGTVHCQLGCPGLLGYGAEFAHLSGGFQ